MGFVRYLQGWIGAVGLVAFGNTVSCFMGHKILADRLYTDAPSEVNALLARLFGIWTLLSSVLRIWCAFNMSNRAVYDLTLFSFILAFLHFASEILIYKTASFNLGVGIPLFVSVGSAILMIIGYTKTESENSDKDEEIDAKVFRISKHKKTQ